MYGQSLLFYIWITTPHEKGEGDSSLRMIKHCLAALETSQKKDSSGGGFVFYLISLLLFFFEKYGRLVIRSLLSIS